MPKLKTHKGSKKRMKVTAGGGVKRRQCGKSHLQSHKTGKRKRQLRRPVVETGVVARKYKEMMGEV
ncbi:MAG: 50S ribosomal protein L35 [Gemmataceae bacterium]